MNTDLETKILEAISSINNYVPVGDTAVLIPEKCVNAIRPIFDQAMRENAVELLDAVKPTYFMDDFGDWRNELGYSFTSDQIFDLFMDSKTKSK